MPLQNRVTPFGELVATHERGMFTGNRGIIHDPGTRTLTRRRWTSKAWIVCSCQYKGVRRDVWAGRSWTELFFLDEAMALAAGHRPCFTCRRDAAEQFRNAWALAQGGTRPSAPQMDDALHAERLDGRRKRVHALPASPLSLPTGTMLTAGTDAMLVAGGQLYRWSFGGYRREDSGIAVDGLLTPPSTVRALAGGYRPVLHASVEGQP